MIFSVVFRAGYCLLFDPHEFLENRLHEQRKRKAGRYSDPAFPWLLTWVPADTCFSGSDRADLVPAPSCDSLGVFSRVLAALNQQDLAFSSTFIQGLPTCF